jgi:Taurine catabolism dioxygenase TauD, TfdA family
VVIGVGVAEGGDMGFPAGACFQARRFEQIRRRVLCPATAWPAPAEGYVPARRVSAANPAELVGRLRGAADTHGVALADLGEPLSAAGLIALGRCLGEPIPEHDPAISEFVEHGFVLNLRDAGATDDVRFKPFSTEELLLHTEGSLRADGERPRWIVLQCRREPDERAGAQTITIDMPGIADRLGPGALAALRRIRITGGSHPVVSGEPAVFAFRDPGVSNDGFESADPGTDPVQMVARLLEALYDPGSVRAIPWRYGLLAVIDNSRVFHGRTRGRVGERRHLQRVRVLDRGARS